MRVSALRVAIAAARACGSPWRRIGTVADVALVQMRVGCLDIICGEDGLLEHYRIKSTVFKRREPRGQPKQRLAIESDVDR